MNLKVKEDQMLLASVEDKFQQSLDNFMITSTNFLDLHQRSMVDKLWKEIGRGQKEVRLRFYGGFTEAERTVAFFLPSYIEEGDNSPMETELAVIRATSPAHGRKLTHRDYLGSLTGLGLKREMIGDILVDDNQADIIILADIADFLLLNYSKAGRTTLSLQRVPLEELHIPEVQTQMVRDTVASLRLDNLVASAFNLSRAKAAEAIKSGIVYVNSLQVEKVDANVNEGDKLVLRGKGKAYLREIGNKSRKDRIFVIIEKYI